MRICMTGLVLSWNIVASENYISLKQISSAKHLFTTARAKECQVARMLSPKQRAKKF